MSFKKLFSKKKKNPVCSAVIVAAGDSVRMGFDKLSGVIKGSTVLNRTIAVFEASPCVEEIIIVTKREKLLEIADMVKSSDFKKVSAVVSGGATRSESSLAGVSAVRPKARLIAIHDAARPLVTVELIERCVNAAAKSLAVIPVIKSKDTLKSISENRVVSAIDRDTTFLVQTPQVFDADMIKGALTHVVNKSLSVTDDSSAAEFMGIYAETVEGDEENIKITSLLDLLIADTILNMREH